MERYFVIQILDDDSNAILTNSFSLDSRENLKAEVEEFFVKANKIFNEWSYEVSDDDEPFSEEEIEFLENELELDLN